MKRRLAALESFARRHDIDVELARTAEVLHWRREYAESLGVEKVIELSRELHAGSSEALTEFGRIVEKEAAYVRARSMEGPPTYQNPAGRSRSIG